MTTPAQNDGVSPETLGLLEHPVDRRLVDNDDVGVRPAFRQRPLGGACRRPQRSGRVPTAGSIVGTLRESCERRQPERAFGWATGSARPWRRRASLAPSRRSPLRHEIPSCSRGTSLARLRWMNSRVHRRCPLADAAAASARVPPIVESRGWSLPGPARGGRGPHAETGVRMHQQVSCRRHVAFQQFFGALWSLPPGSPPFGKFRTARPSSTSC